jgi:hypothetical protein
MHKVMNNRFVVYVFFIHWVATIPMWGQLGGSSTYNFLKLPQSARIEALGGYTVALMDQDPASAFQNPSLLNPKMHHQVSASFNAYFANIGYGSFGYARHWKGIGTFFGGVQYLDYGAFKGTDETGQFTGNFYARDQALMVGYSRSFFDSLLYLGASAKFIYSQYESYLSVGSALDLAATYQSKNRRTHASLVFRNIGSQWIPFTSGQYEPLPFEIVAGFTHELEHLPLRLMVTTANLQRPDLGWDDATGRFQVDPLTGDTIDTRISFGSNLIRHFILGAELMPFKRHLFIRLGYNFMRSGELSVDQAGGAIGLTYGFGIRISHFTFSYGRAEYHPAGSPNHFSLQVNLGGFNKAAKGESDPRLRAKP